MLSSSSLTTAANQSERWLMPRMDRPTSGTVWIASCTCCSTESGSTPGPPEKLSAFSGLGGGMGGGSGRGGAGGRETVEVSLEGLLDLEHMHLLVGEEVFRVHGMDDHCVVDLEDQ